MPKNEDLSNPTAPEATATSGNAADGTDVKGNEENAAPQVPASPPAWSKGGKYKTPEELAAAYDASVNEMKIKEREAAIARKELELERKSRLVTNAPADNAPQQLTEEQKQALEQTYGMAYGQIAAMNDLLDLKLSNAIQSAITPLTETMHNEKLSSIKQNVLAKDTVYQNYAPEFEARLNRLTANKRVDMDEINKIRSEIMVEK